MNYMRVSGGSMCRVVPHVIPCFNHASWHFASSVLLFPHVPDSNFSSSLAVPLFSPLHPYMTSFNFKFIIKGQGKWSHVYATWKERTLCMKVSRVAKSAVWCRRLAETMECMTRG